VIGPSLSEAQMGFSIDDVLLPIASVGRTAPSPAYATGARKVTKSPAGSPLAVHAAFRLFANVDLARSGAECPY
jgi:hypothetical protein